MMDSLPPLLDFLRSYSKVALLLISVFLTGCQSGPQITPDLIIHNVHVVDVGNGEILENRAVYISDNKIYKIERVHDVIVADSTEHLDGNGGYLIPGLWDAHVHVVTERSWSMPMMLAYGITSVRNMHTTEPDPLGKIGMVKKELANNEYPGQRFIANGPIVDGPAEGNWPEAVIVNTGEEARAVVDSLAAGGADFIKVYSSLDREVFLAIMEQAAMRGIPVDGHIPDAVDPLEAARAGLRTSEHNIGINGACTDYWDELQANASGKEDSYEPGPLAFARMLHGTATSYNPEKCQAFLNEYAGTDIVVLPNIIQHAAGLYAQQMVTEAEAMNYLPAGIRGWYNGAAFSPMSNEISELLGPVLERAKQHTKAMHDAGIPILAGTDLGNPFLIPGYSLHEELKLFEEAGLTPAEVLRTATLNPAVTFGFADSLGLIKEGYLADIILLNSNPLEDISAIDGIEAVIRDGKLYTRADLDAILNDLKDQHQQ